MADGVAFEEQEAQTKRGISWMADARPCICRATFLSAHLPDLLPADQYHFLRCASSASVSCCAFGPVRIRSSDARDQWIDEGWTNTKPRRIARGWYSGEYEVLRHRRDGESIHPSCIHHDSLRYPFFVFSPSGCQSALVPVPISWPPLPFVLIVPVRVLAVCACGFTVPFCLGFCLVAELPPAVAFLGTWGTVRLCVVCHASRRVGIVVVSTPSELGHPVAGPARG